MPFATGDVLDPLSDTRWNSESECTESCRIHRPGQPLAAPGPMALWPYGLGSLFTSLFVLQRSAEAWTGVFLCFPPVLKGVHLQTIGKQTSPTWWWCMWCSKSPTTTIKKTSVCSMLFPSLLYWQWFCHLISHVSRMRLWTCSQHASNSHAWVWRGSVTLPGTGANSVRAQMTCKIM